MAKVGNYSMFRSSSRGSGRNRNRGAYLLPSIETLAFKYGIMSYMEPQQIPRGAASDSLNFHTRGSKIETRNGYAPVGLEIAGNGTTRGIFTAHKWDGTEVIVTVRNFKLEYFDDASGLWVEIGSNLLANAPTGEIISFAEYTSPAGAQLWVSSPSTVLIKIMTANMASYVDQYDSSKNFKGYIRIYQNAMRLWGYLGNSLGRGTNSALRRSHIDGQAYATVTGEAIATGDGSTKTFNGTFSTISGKKTCFATTFTDGVETFADDFLGTLTGSHGGTGTVNYATGVYSITFNTAPINLAAITSDYATEDATNTGIADFTQSGSRLASEGVTFLQNFGGRLLDVFVLNGSEYCLHERAAWVVTIAADDTSATNLVYRERLALASQRGGVATADGVYYIDTTNKSRPYVAKLSYNVQSTLVLPTDLSSKILDLTPYSPDQCVAWEWEKYIIFAIRTKDSLINNRLLLLNKELGSFDVDDFYSNGFCNKDGALIAGDSVTANVYNFYSGFDDNGAIPNAYWIGNLDDHGMGGLKKTREEWIEGDIDENQIVDVLVSVDRSAFVKIGEIDGTGSYVDHGQAVLIGSLIVGLNAVGGGSNGASAFHYLRKITVGQGRYKYFQIMFQPQGIGYFSVTQYTNHAVFQKEDKLPVKYR